MISRKKRYQIINKVEQNDLMAKKIGSEELSKKQLPHQKLKPDQKMDLRLTASNMTRIKKRAFQAEIAVKYC